MRINFLLRIIFSLIIIVFLLVYSLYNGFIRFNYPSLTQYPIQGIDVSHHQKNIDWNRLDKKKVRFVFIKATEGRDFKDKSFMTNWHAAREQGFIVGAYHFFVFCKTGAEQAQNFIETVPKKSGTLPPVLDLEYGGNCQLTTSKERIRAEIEEMVKQLESAYGKKPILYATREFFDDFLVNEFKELPIWIRDIYRHPSLNDNNRKWLFWQYANRGRLDGIETFVDLNAFNGSETELFTLLK
ncbi:lysozyme [Pragia fontium]|uniref:Lysozyme n=1 Tax=Pragia fontium TaxID=82985 RepID=A0ABQ5LI12_9GAMM|nr:glycoside hydrolase family 25 protein [Pragia fontium]GKX63242.1 lysozyme [Pragia fontium]